jgi:hypothetical protein
VGSTFRHARPTLARVEPPQRRTVDRVGGQTDLSRGASTNSGAAGLSRPGYPTARTQAEASRILADCANTDGESCHLP